MGDIVEFAFKRSLVDKIDMNWLTHVFDAMNAGFVVTDPLKDDNPIVFVNKKFEEVTGYSSEEIIGRNCRFLQGKDSDKKTIKKIRETIDNKEVGEFLILNYRKDGKTFWNKLYISPVFNNENKLINFIGIQHVVKKEGSQN